MPVNNFGYPFSSSANVIGQNEFRMFSARLFYLK